MTATRARDERKRFTMIPDWLVESSAISLHDYAVLIVLMKHGRTGECRPGFATIGREARVSRDTVKRSLRSLEARGLIEIKRRRVGTKNLPNLYTLHVEPSRVGAHSTHPEHARTSNGVGADGTQVGAHSTQGVGADSTPNETPYNETHERNSRVHRDATHDDADDIDDVSAIESGDAPSVGVVESRRTDAQVSLLSDLHIFATRRTPSTRTIETFRRLTNAECTETISTYWRQIDGHGRGPAYDGPEPGDRTYEHLSARGQQWADVALLPSEMSP